MSKINLSESEWRYDRIPEAEVWPACIWEYGRRWERTATDEARRKFNKATIPHLKEMPPFPETPWLELDLETRFKCIKRWTSRPGDLENYDVVASGDIEAMVGRSPDEIKNFMHKRGLVIFDLGVPPRFDRGMRPGKSLRPWQEAFGKPPRQPTYAERLAEYEAWLDAHPEQWDGRGDGRTVTKVAGKRSPRDGLRALAWTKIREASESDKAACEYLAEMFARDSSLKAWFAISLAPRSVADRSRLCATSRKWQRLVCEAK